MTYARKSHQDGLRRVCRVPGRLIPLVSLKNLRNGRFSAFLPSCSMLFPFNKPSEAVSWLFMPLAACSEAVAVLKRWRALVVFGRRCPRAAAIPFSLPSRMSQRASRVPWRSRVPAPTRSEVLVSRRRGRGRSPGGLVRPPWGTVVFGCLARVGALLGRPAQLVGFGPPR